MKKHIGFVMITIVLATRFVTRLTFINKEINLQFILRACGLMDKAPDFGSGDCRFESCHARDSLS